MSYPYLCLVPRAYHDEPERLWPLLLFLHGAGERGEDLAVLKRNGPPRVATGDPDFPFVVVAPQCRRGEGWQPRRVKALLDEVAAELRLDLDRLYLTGLSMGGYGTWYTLAMYPDIFAAAAPICGGGDPDHAPRLRSVPIWTFHGALDDVVPLSETRRMVQAVEAAGGDVRFTVYPDADHDSWTRTYDDPALYDWLLSHRLSTRTGHAYQAAD